MREIDPVHDNSEARLRHALRSLSAGSPADAPPEIGETVARAFHRHHARRRMLRRTALAAAIFAVLLPAAVLLMRKQPAGPHPGVSAVVKAPAPAPASPSVMPPAAPVATASASAPQVRKLRSAPAASQSAKAAGNDFVVLPSADQAVRGEELRVVRLELTGKALRLVGAPVNEEIEDHRFLADLVVGQDGTAYAVRLVR